MPVHQPPFDPSRDFKALRFFRFNGNIILRDDPFSIDEIDPRKARQLYENRFIGYADVDYVRKTTPTPPAKSRKQAPHGDLAGDDLDAQIKALTDRYTRDQLLNIAQGLELASSATKPVIAEAIIKAGRADNEPS